MAASGCVFAASVLVAYFQFKNVSLSAFLIMQAIFSLSMVIFEVPSGYLSDRFSRRGVLLGGVALLLVANFVLLFSSHSFSLTAGLILMAGGRSLISGTASALLYDTMLSCNLLDDYVVEEGRMKSWTAYSFSASGLTGSLLFSIYPDFPQALTCVTMAVALWFALQLKEPPQHKPTQQPSPLREMASFVRYCLVGHEELPWLIAYSGLICSGTLMGFWLMQPYWESMGIHLAFFGILFFATQTARGFSLARSSSLIRRVNSRKLAIGLFLLLCLGFSLQSVFDHPLAAVLTLLPAIIYGVCHVMILDLINKRVESHMRATVLSVESLAWRLGFAVAAHVVGFCIDAYSLPFTFLLCAVTWLLLGVYPLYQLCFKPRMEPDPLATGRVVRTIIS